MQPRPPRVTAADPAPNVRAWARDTPPHPCPLPRGAAEGLLVFSAAAALCRHLTRPPGTEQGCAGKGLLYQLLLGFKPKEKGLCMQDRPAVLKLPNAATP